MQWTSLAASMLAAVYQRNLSLTFLLPFFLPWIASFILQPALTWLIQWHSCDFLWPFIHLGGIFVYFCTDLRFYFISFPSFPTYPDCLSLSLEQKRTTYLVPFIQLTAAAASAPIEFNETKGKCRKLSFPEFAHSGVVLPALALHLTFTSLESEWERHLGLFKCFSGYLIWKKNAIILPWTRKCFIILKYCLNNENFQIFFIF